MQTQAALADAQLFRPHTRPNMDEKRVITDYRDTGYREGDILLDIIKEGLIKKRIAIDALPSMGIFDIAEIIEYFNVQNPTMQGLMKGLEAEKCRIPMNSQTG
ncbi:MAG: hypothetical protein IPL59_25730 [Candidatus Competibacteraceae bacterium]|nr:hypothetical protein [Candidatus Competibacteraceae bacterium]